MAVLGSATIVVRAITTGFKEDLQKSMREVAREAENSGKAVSNAFNKGMKSGRGGGRGGGFFDDVARGIRKLDNESKGALKRLNMMEAAFLNISSVVVLVGGGIGALITSLVTLVGVLGAVAASSVAAVGALASLGAGAFAAKFALGGVGAAVSQATKANGGYGKSIKQIREELQQLRFDAKDAELSEREAALNVEKARENLLRMADLPPNSMARREAQLQYDQAEQAYKRAKDRAKDLKDQLKDGIDPTQGGGAGADPYAGLTKSQKEFAKRLVALQPIFKSLKEEIAKGFLPTLGDGLEAATDILDKRLRPALGRLGDSLGIASFNFFDRILSDNSVKLFERFVDKSGPRVQQFGSIFGNLFEAFFGLLDAAAPLIDRFVTYLDDASLKLAEFFSGGEDDAGLVAFFESVGDTAAQVGRIFGNLFRGLGVLIETTTGPGSGGAYLLDWFEEITAGFANMGDSEKGELKQFFLDSAKNAKVFLQLLGDIFGIFNDIGADPRLGEAFAKLREGVPFLEQIVEPFLAVSGTVADVFVRIAEIVSLLVDTDTVKAFFETILNIVTGIRDFLAREDVQKALKDYGPLLAQIGAGFFVFEKLRPLFLGIANGAMLVLNPIGNLFSAIIGKGGKGGIAGAVSNFGQLIKQPGGFMKALKGAGIVGLIITIVGKIIEFYTKFEDFKEMIDNTLKDVAASFGGAFEEIGELFGNLFGNEEGGGLLGAFDPILKFLLEFIIPILGNALKTFASVVELIFGLLNTVLEAVVPPIAAIIDGIVLLFEGDFQGGMQKILQGIGGIIVGIAQVVVNGFIDILNFGIRQFQNFVNTIGNTPLGDFVRDVFGIDLATFKLGEIKNVNWVADMMKNSASMAPKSSLTNNSMSGGSRDRIRANGLPKLADGGIVQATTGGVVAIIGEGGQRERVEPLDANGLSERDKSIINMLSGGTGVTIHVHPSQGMNETELANIVSRKLAVEMGKGKF
jgi:tetratricopeptide (TPR) repeat protein